MTGRRERVRAPGCGPGLEGHRREPTRGSWDVAQWAGSGKTQITRQDRASCGLASADPERAAPALFVAVLWAVIFFDVRRALAGPFIGFMRGLANDVTGDGITANAVSPGLINTLATAPQSEEQKRSTWNSTPSSGWAIPRM